MCCFNIFILYPNDKNRIPQILKENIDRYLTKYITEEHRMILVEIVKTYIDSVFVAINPIQSTNFYEFPISYYDPKSNPEETCLGLDDGKRDQIEHHGTGIIELGGMIFHCGFLGTNIHDHYDHNFFDNIITPQTKHLVMENIKTHLSAIFNVDECQSIADHCLKYIETVINNIKPSLSSHHGFVAKNEFNFPIVYFKITSGQQQSNAGTGLFPIGDYLVQCYLLSCDCYPIPTN